MTQAGFPYVNNIKTKIMKKQLQAT